MSDPTLPRSNPQKVIPIQSVGAREEMVSLYQKGEKIYAREVKGWFTRWRWVFVWLTQIVFYLSNEK